MKDKLSAFTFFFSILYFFCIVQAQTNKSLLGPDSLSIEQAIQNAFANRSILKALQRTTQERDYLALAQLSGYLPQFNISTRFQNVIKAISANDYRNRRILPVRQTSIEIRQFILKFGGPIELYHIGRQETEIAKLQEAFQEDLIQFQIEQTFLVLWDELLKEQSIKLLERAAVRQFAKARVDQEVGFLNLSQWDNEQALIAERMSIVKKYPDELSRARVAFERAIEQPLDHSFNNNALKHFVLSSINSAQKYPLDFYLKKAYLHRKDFLIKEEEIIREQWREKFRVRSYLPSASFFANITSGSIFAQGIPPTICGKTFWQFGLRFDWDFDGLSNAHEAGAAHAATLAAHLQKKDLGRQIDLEVQTSYFELQELSKDLKAAQLRIAQQEQEFERQKAQHKVGEISDVEWTVAEQDWEDAQFNLLDLERQTSTKQRELLFNCGYPPLENDEYTIAA